MNNLLFTPINVLSNVGAAASKLNDFYNLGIDGIKNKLRENATPKNIAYVTLTAAAVTSALLCPTTRIAICTLLSISYSLSMIALNLVILGLYLIVSGTKGLTSLASLFAGSAQGLASSVKEGLNGPQTDTVATSPKVETIGEKLPSQEPVSNPSPVKEEILDKVWEEAQNAKTVEQPHVESKTSDNLRQESESTGEKLPSQEPVSNPSPVKEEILDKVWEEAQNAKTVEQPHVESKTSDNLRQESESIVSDMNKTPTASRWAEEFSALNEMGLTEAELDTLYEDLNGVNKTPPTSTTSQWVEDFSAPNKTGFTDTKLDKLWEGLNDVNKTPLTSTTSQWVEDFSASQKIKSTVPIKNETSWKKGAPLPSTDTLIKDFSNWKYSSAKVGQWVNEFAGDQMAEEFLKQQKGNDILKPFIVGAGVAATLFATYKAYKAFQEYEVEEESSTETGVSYANVSRDVIPDAEEPYRSDFYDNWGFFGGFGE